MHVADTVTDLGLQRNGLKIYAQLDDREYEKGIKISEISTGNGPSHIGEVHKWIWT